MFRNVFLQEVVTKNLQAPRLLITVYTNKSVQIIIVQPDKFLK